MFFLNLAGARAEFQTQSKAEPRPCPGLPNSKKKGAAGQSQLGLDFGAIIFSQIRFFLNLAGAGAESQAQSKAQPRPCPGQHPFPRAKKGGGWPEPAGTGFWRFPIFFSNPIFFSIWLAVMADFFPQNQEKRSLFRIPILYPAECCVYAAEC